MLTTTFSGMALFTTRLSSAVLPQRTKVGSVVTWRTNVLSQLVSIRSLRNPQRSMESPYAIRLKSVLLSTTAAKRQKRTSMSCLLLQRLLLPSQDESRTDKKEKKRKTDAGELPEDKKEKKSKSLRQSKSPR